MQTIFALFAKIVWSDHCVRCTLKGVENQLYFWFEMGIAK